MCRSLLHIFVPRLAIHKEVSRPRNHAFEKSIDPIVGMNPSNIRGNRHQVSSKQLRLLASKYVEALLLDKKIVFEKLTYDLVAHFALQLVTALLLKNRGLHEETRELSASFLRAAQLIPWNDPRPGSRDRHPAMNEK